MPQIAGFRGVLYDASKVALAKVVASQADATQDAHGTSPATARAIALEPHHISRLVTATPGGGDTIASWLAAGTLQRDPGRAVYRYHQVFRENERVVTRKSLIAAVRLSPWSEKMIRPHELTAPDERDAALRSIQANAGHVEPVVGGYLDAAGEIDRLLKRVEGERPTFEVATADGTTHRVWRMRDAEVLGKLRHGFAPKRIDILEGHGRYEAMLAYRDALEATAPLSLYSSGNYGLMSLVDLADTSLRVGARHRVVRGPITRDAVLAAARKWFIVEPIAGAARDAARLQAALADTLAHQPAFVAVFAGDTDAWKLTLSPDVSPASEGIEIHRALAKLDPVIVDTLFIKRALGDGVTVTTEVDVPAALARVQSGAALAVIVRPLSLEQIRQTSELGQTLPAGSTALVPRIANGLVMSQIDADDDLV
jgi:uncharacterized protein (DUF1015 family)